MSIQRTNNHYILVLIILMPTISSCHRTQRHIDVKGVWAELTDSSYREHIYGDSTIWVYTEEAGVVKLKYRIRDMTLTKYYLDDVELLSLLVSSVDSDEFIYSYKGQTHESRRLKLDIDLEKLMADDTIEFASYLAGYFARRDSAMSYKRKTN